MATSKAAGFEDEELQEVECIFDAFWILNIKRILSDLEHRKSDDLVEHVVLHRR